MKKKHTWISSVPKTRREKTILKLMNDPSECKKLSELLNSANNVVQGFRDLENSGFKNIDELIFFITSHISDEFPRKEVLLEELKRLVENYEERLVSGEAVGKDPSI